jgi:hypothetical protein
VTTTYAGYDGLNRPLTKTYTNSAPVTPTVTYGYDQDGKGAPSSVSTTAGGTFKCEDPLDCSALVSALCLTVPNSDGPRIFDLMLHNRPRLEDFRLLAKLSEFPSIERSVRDYLVKALEERDLRAGDLEYISKVRDPRITEQLKRREHSEDGAVRLIAQVFREV